MAHESALRTPEGSLAQSVSLWQGSTALPPLPPLERSTRADVCVIGAGMAGLSTAYMLTRAGHSVVVLDDGPIASGQTLRSTGHLSSAIDDRYYELERLHGVAGAKLAAQSHAASIDCIETIAAEEGIDCDFERLDGYLFVGEEQPADIAQRELQAARRAGLAGVDWLPRLPWRTVRLGPCLRFPRQAQFHPVKYLVALAAAIERRGGRIRAAHATSVTGGSKAGVRTRGGSTVHCGAVVVATNTPVNNRFAIHTKQAAYRTYVIAGRLPAGTVPRALYWDTLDPYHYIRLQAHADGANDYVLVGGEDHKTGQDDDPEPRYARLLHWTRERLPGFDGPQFRWSGQILETVDGLAYIGRNPRDHDNVFIATGDSGMGLTHGTIAGLLLTALIDGRAHPWAALYDPRRKSLRAAPAFVKENLDVARRYAEWFTPCEGHTADIAPGSGMVLRRGLRPVAAYRDLEGRLHRCSAVCPHLGCLVHWNPAERSWDCPCHGSRFDAHGAVVNGPANRDLVKLGE